MTKQTKLEQLTKAIQIAVPEIMELEMGCKVYVDWSDKAGIITILSSPKNGYVDWKCGVLKVGEFKILGRDITLEDCLIVLDNLKFEPDMGINFNKGEIQYWDENSDTVIDSCKWILNKPLHQQEQETIDLLCDLICKE